MFGLVQADFTASGKRYSGQASPLDRLDRRTGDLVFRQPRHGRPEVITHEEKFVKIIFLRWMEGSFGRRQSKDQPAVSGVDCGKLENVAEKGAISLGILAVNNHVGTGDHGHPRIG